MKILMLVLTLSLSLTNMSRAADEETHQAIALFLYNFANYVDWPSDAFTSKKESLNMCVVGKARFVPYLDVFEGTLIRDRYLSIVKLPQINLDKRCHVLFLDEEEKAMIENIQVIHTSDFVLSISDDTEFVEDGGVVSVFAREEAVQFDVNLGQALRNGLYISSDLLGIARSVKR